MDLNDAKKITGKALNEWFMYQSERAELLKKASDIYLAANDEQNAKTANFDSNIFSFRAKNIVNHSLGKKGDRFVPTFTATDENGNKHFSPDPAWVDSEMLEHIKKRLSETTNPQVLARYYDLLFEFEKKDGLNNALNARENYRKAAREEYQRGWEFEVQDSLIRSLELVAKLNDKAKIQESAEEIVGYIIRFNDDKKSRYVIELAEALLVEPIEFASMIQRVIQELKKAANSFGENEHLKRSVLGLLKRFLSIQGQAQDMSEVDEEIVQSYLSEANIKSASGLVEAHFVEEAFNYCQSIGDPKGHSVELRRRMQEAYKRSEGEFKEIAVEVPVPVNEIRELIRKYIGNNVDEIPGRVALSRLLVPSYDQAAQLTSRLMKEFPLQFLVTKQTINDGIKISEREGNSDLEEDSVIEQLSQSITLSSLNLRIVFEEMAAKGCGYDQVIKTLIDTPVFTDADYDNIEAIMLGVKDFYDKRYFSCLATLLPEIEQLLRLVVYKLGIPTMIINSSGRQQFMTLGEVLDKLRFGLEEDVYWYLKLILQDPRGLNLRNNHAHGLMRVSPQNEDQARYIMHILLLLTRINFKSLIR